MPKAAFGQTRRQCLQRDSIWLLASRTASSTQLGGQVAGSFDRVGTMEAYDPVADTWTTNAPMPTARKLLAVGVVNGILYAIGGCADNDCGSLLSTVEAYDPVSNTWTNKAPIPTPRREFVVGVVNGILYAVGGYQGPGSSPITSVQAYDPVSDTWTNKAPMPTAQNYTAAGVVNGILYVMGCNNTPNTGLTHINWRGCV